MAAEGNRRGAFILEVAGSGRNVATTFAKYITSQKGRIANLETLYADISISASLLTDLGTMINKYENDVYIRDDITRPICEICATHFEKLQVVLREAAETGMWKSDGGVNVWVLFCTALGGLREAAELCRRIESTRHSLLLLADTIKYTIFKKLNEE